MKTPMGISRSLVALLLCLASVVTLATVSGADDSARTGVEAVSADRTIAEPAPAPTEVPELPVAVPVADPPVFDDADTPVAPEVDDVAPRGPAIRLPGGGIVRLNDLAGTSNEERPLPLGTTQPDDGPKKLSSEAQILRAEEGPRPVPPQPEPTATPTPTVTPDPTPTPNPTPPQYDPWLPVRMCESTNTYNINTGNGYYGAYQFSISTWNWVAGIIGRADLVGLRPDLASPADQDAMANALAFEVPGGGLHHWPVCGRLYGT